jgi:hypothetical protein
MMLFSCTFGTMHGSSGARQWLHAMHSRRSLFAHARHAEWPFSHRTTKSRVDLIHISQFHVAVFSGGVVHGKTCGGLVLNRMDSISSIGARAYLFLHNFDIFTHRSTF